MGINSWLSIQNDSVNCETKELIEVSWKEIFTKYLEFQFYTNWNWNKIDIQSK